MALYTKMMEMMPRMTNPDISEVTAPSMTMFHPLPFRQASVPMSDIRPVMMNREGRS